VGEGRRVRLDYYAYGRDERSTRDVDPVAVFAHEGSWYVRGWCHQAGGHRLFRVDRVVEVTPLDHTFDAAALAGATDAGGVFAAGPEDPRITLDVAPSARWVVDTYPVEDVRTTEDGRLRVRLAVTATPWLERLLLRLGPDARVVEADDPSHQQAGRRAAERILDRYGGA
jgi:proteasome accessory factor C